MLLQILKTQLRFLAFMPIRLNLKTQFWPYFAFVLGASWLVGMGRYWDHPNAHWWQYAGLGSVAYICCLSIILYLVVAPLKPKNWSFKSVFIFVGLTALPALLYAIPVEQFMGLKEAQHTNAIFLAIVAIWRVALYMKFLVSAAKLHTFSAIVATLLPLTAIVFSLTSLNLEHVVFNIMAGIQETNASPYDAAYVIIWLLTMLSVMVLPVTLLAYFATIITLHARSHLSASTSN